MDFFKQAASFAQSKKSDESSGSTGGGFDVSDLMSKAEGFLAEKKTPEAAAVAPETEEEKEVVKKPSEDTPAPKEDVVEDPPTTESTSSSAEPVVVQEESSEVPPTKPTSNEASIDSKPSYSELYGSAQTLYSGLRGKLAGKTDVDDQQLASAAEDLVKGAESLGLVKPDSPYSDYFKKAEGYLQKESSSGSAPKEPSSDQSA